MTVGELEAYGMVEMTGEEIHGYLASQHVGVLGLPATDVPSLRPLSFGFDGDAGLYFVYVLGGEEGSESRKAELTERAERARFLVYSAETPFNWRSVLLTGTIHRVPEEERDRAEAALDGAWRPDVFERAGATETTRLYRFDIEGWTGLKHIGLPPEFDEPVGRPTE